MEPTEIQKAIDALLSDIAGNEDRLKAEIASHCANMRFHASNISKQIEIELNEAGMVATRTEHHLKAALIALGDKVMVTSEHYIAAIGHYLHTHDNGDGTVTVSVQPIPAPATPAAPEAAPAAAVATDQATA